MGKALYRKYRSRALEEIVGQPQVTQLLARALKQGRIAHAYLFTGPKGVGKTSIARILAHEINELPYNDDSSYLDIIEIDAASNNGVEDIRDLREKVRLAPINAKKKVYIIDEVHMLSKPAFNALLKTLEEPPEHVVFILATTDVEKIPDTILSRTQRHTFRRASDKDLIQNLERIAKGENIKVTHDALATIARHSDGSYRDSVSLLDQLISLSDDTEGVTSELVATSLGLAPDELIVTLAEASVAHNVPLVIEILSELEQRGTPNKTILHQLCEYLRSHVVDNPTYAELLSQLLDLHTSSTLELKLLTTLTLFNVPARFKELPEDVSASEHKSARISEVEKPTEEISVTVATEPQETDDSNGEGKKSPDTKKSKSSKKNNDTAFDWQKLLTHVRSHHVVLHSVLSKCEPSLEDGTLTLYTKNKFYKTKLDSPKFRSLLSSSLDETGMGPYEIDTKPTSAPLKDSQAAKVAAIMGGGEEVSVEDA